jgi:hypothetical protein
VRCRMHESEERLWVEKCGEILHRMLVEIRSLSWQAGNEKRINDLADLAHNLPHIMIGRYQGPHSWLRTELVNVAKKYRPELDPTKDRYVFIMDMDEKAFNEVYRRTSWVCPEPEPLVG